MSDHLDLQDVPHNETTETSEEQLRSTKMAESLVKMALSVVDDKGSVMDFESRIGLAMCVGIEVGDIENYRNIFDEVLKAATVHLCEKNGEELLNPLENTGIPPHLCFFMEQSTRNRKTNEAVFVMAMVKGTRIAVPVVVPQIYYDSSYDDVQEEDPEPEFVDPLTETNMLAYHIVNSITIKLDVPESHLTYITGGVYNGHIPISVFKERICEMVKGGDSIYSMPVTWNSFLTLAVDDFMLGITQLGKSDKLLRRVLNRLLAFARQFSYMEGVLPPKGIPNEELDLIFYVNRIYGEEHRFVLFAAKMFSRLLNNYLEFYRAYQKLNSLGEIHPYDESRSKIDGTDFVFDLLFLKDILNPLVESIEFLQGFEVPIWKTPILMDRLIQYLEEMNFSTFSRLPTLKRHFDDLQKMVFKECELDDGQQLLSVTRIFPTDEEDVQEPNKKKKKKTMTTVEDWANREIKEDCIPEAESFKCHLVKSLKDRRDKVLPAAESLAKCIDFHKIFTLLCGNRKAGSLKTPYDEMKLILYGKNEFSDFVSYVSKLPHIVANEDITLDVIMSSNIHDKIKECFASIIWGDLLATVGSKVFLPTNDNIDLADLCGELKVTSFQPSNQTDIFHVNNPFEITFNSTSNKENVVQVTLNEKMLWKEIYTNKRVYKLLGRPACIVLDVALSLGCTEAVAESYYTFMAKHRKKESSDTLDMRTLVDWCMPPIFSYPNTGDPKTVQELILSCPNTVKDIAKVYRQGDLESKVSKYRAPIRQCKQDKPDENSRS